MSYEVMAYVVLALVGFVVGWVGSEAYTFYKHSKEKRWR
jgi:hypothetical protein